MKRNDEFGTLNDEFEVAQEVVSCDGPKRSSSHSSFTIPNSSFFFIPHPSMIWSGRRDLNSRPSPWQGDALPLSYSRLSTVDSNDWPDVVNRSHSLHQTPRTRRSLY